MAEIRGEGQISFRGLVMDRDDAGRGGGRRGATHERPHNDTPTGADMGRKVRTFRFSGVLMTNEDGGEARRRAWLDALEQYGPGRYVDEFGDAWTVKVTRYSERTTKTSGGVSYFQIEFEEWGDQPLAVSSTVDTAAVLATSADALDAATVAAFVSKFATSGPEFIRSAGISAVQGLGMGLVAAAGVAGVAALERVGIMDSVAEFAGTETGQLLFAGAKAAISIASNAMPDTGSRTRMLLSVAGTAVDATASLAAPQTANRKIEQSNMTATGAMIRRVALAEIARTTPSAEFASYDAADGYLGAVTAAFEAETLKAGSDDPAVASPEVFQALIRAGADAVADVRPRGAKLARLTAAVLPVAVPAVVEAYKRYDDKDRADDIAARNGVTNPNFLPPGQELELLNS